jgi:hypothetical protein
VGQTGSGFANNWVCGLSGAVGPTGVQGPTGTGGALGYWGSFWSDVSQNLVGATGTAMTLNHTDPDTSGVSIVSNSQVTVANTGVYNIQFSAQVEDLNNPAGSIFIWFKKNGAAIPESNTNLSLDNQNGFAVAAWNFMLKLNAGDYIQIFWYSTDAGVKLIAAGSFGDIPAIPSVIVTVQQVMYTQLGPTGATGPTGPTGPPGNQIIYVTTTPYSVAASTNNDQITYISDIPPTPDDYYQLGTTGGANNTVNAILVDSTTTPTYFHMGGSFTSINGTAVSLAAKTDLNGTVIDTLNGGINGTSVNCLSYLNDLYVGGTFTTSVTTGTPLNNIGKYIGATGAWSNMGGGTTPGLNSTVNSIEVFDNQTKTIGGNFTADSNSNDMAYVSRYDVSNNTFAPLQDPQITPYGVNGNVYAVEVDAVNNCIYIGGTFSIAGEIQATNVARYDLTNKKWESLSGVATISGSYIYQSVGEGAGGLSNSVYALYWDSVNSRLFVGGAFTNVQGAQVTATNVAYWTPGSSNSASGSWAPLNGVGGEGVFGSISEVYVITGDGTNIYVGGQFQNAYIGGISTNVYNIAYWNPSGPTWNVLGGIGGVGTSGAVYALNWVASGLPTITSGLFVGGDFIYVEIGGGPVIANHIALWSPSGTGLWYEIYQGVGSGQVPGMTSSSVRTLAWDSVNNRLFIGGSFLQVNWYDGSSPQTYDYPYMVVWIPSSISYPTADGTWSNSVTSMDQPVFSLNYGSDGAVYAGGQFTNAGGQTVNYVARWDTVATVWTPLPDLPSIGPGRGLNAAVYSVKYHSTGDIVITGGAFTRAYEAKSNIIVNYVAYYGNAGYTWYPLAETVLPYGVKNASAPSGNIYAIAVDASSNLMYVGGDFINAGGVYTSNIAMYNYSTNVWYPFIDNNTKINGTSAPVRALLWDSPILYVGGEFITAGGTTVNHIAKWSSNVWSPLIDGSGNGTDGPVYCITNYISDFYIGGSFANAGGQSANNVAWWNGSNWNPLLGTTYLGNGTNGPVYAILAYYGLLNTGIVIGGLFTDAGGQGVTNLAIWSNYSGSDDFSPCSDSFGNQGTNATVYALSKGNTTNLIYVGGAFTTAGALSPANYIASWTWLGFPVFYGTWAVVGNNTIGGVGAQGVRTLTYDATNTKLYIGGIFNQVGILSYYGTYSVLQDVNFITVFNDGGGPNEYDTLPTSSASALLGTAANGVGNNVYATYYSSADNYLFVGGDFQLLFNLSPSNYKNSHNVAIIDRTASQWITTPSPVPKLNGQVRTIKQLNATNIYVGGDFTGLSGGNQDFNYIARWNITNSLWYSFVTNSVIGMNGAVYDIKVNDTTSLFIGGAFTSAGATTLNRIGLYDVSSNSWTQFISLGGSDVGVNGTVRNIYYRGAGLDAYICGEFTATTGSSLSVNRVAEINTSNQTFQIKNVSGTHTGLNDITNAILYSGSKVYFGGQFTNTAPTSDKPMSRIASYNLSSSVPVILTTTTAGFLDTDDSTTYSQIILPVQYKAVTVIYNASINKWLETYRSSGVTH